MNLPSHRITIAAFVLLACGPTAGSEEDGGSGSADETADDGADASASASASADASASAADDDASASITTSADDDSTGAQSCEMYDEAEIGPEVAIEIRHTGTLPVFFAPHGCGGAITFEITSAGASIPYLLDTECSPNTCAGYVGADDCFVACNDCGSPSAGRIDVGAIGEGTWPGRGLTELELLAECVPAGDCPASCVRPDQAPPGTYEIALTVYRRCEGVCECDGPSPGVCSLWNGEQLADPVTFRTTIEYPAQTSADLVITD